jgi:hypothetical protein
VKFYRGNRIDGEFEQDLIALADQFWPSRQGAAVLRGQMLDRALRDFLTDPAGFNSSWTDEAGYEELWQLVRDRWPEEQPFQGAWT